MMVVMMEMKLKVVEDNQVLLIDLEVVGVVEDAVVGSFVLELKDKFEFQLMGHLVNMVHVMVDGEGHLVVH